MRRDSPAARAGPFVSRAPIEVLRGDDPCPAARVASCSAWASSSAPPNWRRARIRVRRVQRLAVWRCRSAGSLAQTLFGGAGNVWRRGTTIRLARTARPRRRGSSTCCSARRSNACRSASSRSAAPRPGLKLLTVEAPPRHLLRILPAILNGTRGSKAVAQDFTRSDPGVMHVTAGEGFILDGELYEGGELTLRAGESRIRFAAA